MSKMCEPTYQLPLQIGLSKELSPLMVQMRTVKIGLREFFFNRKLPEIEDGRCEYEHGSQTVKYALRECRLFARQRRDLRTGGKKNTQTRRKSFDYRAHCYGCSLRQKSGNLRKEDAADWPVYGPPHAHVRKLM